MVADRFDSKHLERDHHFLRGPVRPNVAKRYRWLALFNVDDVAVPENGPIFCLPCSKGFKGRKAYKTHRDNPRHCINSKSAFIERRIAVQTAFTPYVVPVSEHTSEGEDDYDNLMAALTAN